MKHKLLRMDNTECRSSTMRNVLSAAVVFLSLPVILPAFFSSQAKAECSDCAGTIIIEKKIFPNPAANDATRNIAFSFESDLPSQLGIDNDGGSFTLKADTTTTRSDLDQRTYTITENAVDNWSVKDITCTATKADGTSEGTTSFVTIYGADNNPDGDTLRDGFDEGDTSIAICLSGGETVKCTYTNAPSGKVVVNKVTQASKNTPPTFTDGVLDTVDTESDTAFTINLVGDTTSSTTVTGVPTDPALDGEDELTDNTHTFDVLSGSTFYSLTETDLPEGWVQVSTVCKDSQGATVPFDHFKVASPGEVITCTVTNLETPCWCGDGRRNNDEQCDLGSANGSDNSVCTADCKLRPKIKITKEGGSATAASHFSATGFSSETDQFTLDINADDDTFNDSIQVLIALPLTDGVSADSADISVTEARVFNSTLKSIECKCFSTVSGSEVTDGCSDWFSVDVRAGTVTSTLFTGDSLECTFTNEEIPIVCPNGCPAPEPAPAAPADTISSAAPQPVDAAAVANTPAASNSAPAATADDTTADTGAVAVKSGGCSSTGGSGVGSLPALLLLMTSLVALRVRRGLKVKN